MQPTNDFMTTDENTMIFSGRMNPLCSDKQYLERNRIRSVWFSDTFCYRESYFLTNKNENLETLK